MTRLCDVVKLEPFMKIAIDGEVNYNGIPCINVGYLRVSTDRQADFGYGLEIQEHSIAEYCKRNGYTNLLLFVDDGYSGTTMERPAIKKLIEMIKAFNEGTSSVKLNSFVIMRIDRVSRTLLNTLHFIYDYIICSKNPKASEINTNKEDINFISVNEPFIKVEKDNSQTTLMLELFATFAEYDRNQTVEKLNRGRAVRISKGKWMGGGKVPFGYRYNKNTGLLESVEGDAEKIREVFRLYIEEKATPQKIADMLGFKSDVAVRQILKRKSLTGCLLWHGEEYEGVHTPIISLERFNEAQEELKKRGTVRSGGTHMLTGLIFCGECGARMRYQKWGGSGVRILCYSRQPSKQKMVKAEKCDNEIFIAEEIEKAVTDEMFAFVHLANSENTKGVPIFDAEKALQNALEKEKRELKMLYGLYAESGSGTLLSVIKEREAKIAGLNSQIAEEIKTRSLNAQISKTYNSVRSLEGQWSSMTPKEKKAVCGELIEKITIYKEGTVKINFKHERFFEKKNATV